MQLYVFGATTRGQARLVALLDNLGKGASGAAVQNLNLMLGLPEADGLDDHGIVSEDACNPGAWSVVSARHDTPACSSRPPPPSGGPRAARPWPSCAARRPPPPIRFADSPWRKLTDADWKRAPPAAVL